MKPTAKAIEAALAAHQEARRQEELSGQTTSQMWMQQVLTARLAPVDDEALVEIAAAAIRRNKFERTGRLDCFDPSNLTPEELGEGRAAIAAIRPHIEADIARAMEAAGCTSAQVAQVIALLSSSCPALPVSQDAFNAFWRAYPRKVARVKAEQAFAKVAQEAPAIMTGLDKYIRHKPDYADWMHPATFLNGRRWEDEYDAPVSLGRTYDARKDGLALFINEAKRHERTAEQANVTGKVVRLLPRPDMERGDDKEQDGDILVGAGPLF